MEGRTTTLRLSEDKSEASSNTLSTDIHFIDRWDFTKGKEAGAKGAGKLGGFYKHKSEDPDVKEIFFKQDPAIANNIGEFIASRLMRLVAGEDRDMIAQVELAIPSDQVEADPSGKNVYLASVIYPGFREVFKDARLAFAYLEQFEALRELNPTWLNEAAIQRKDRPGFLENDKFIDLMIDNGRYQSIFKIIALSLWIDDPDVHMGNIGVVPKGKHITRVENKEKETTKDIPVNVTPVRIDFGAAFGDNRFTGRKFDGELHLNDLCRYFPSHQGPPNYFRKITDNITNNIGFARELRKIYEFDQELLHKELKSIIGEVGRYFGVEPLADFAILIGLDANYILKQNIEESLKKELLLEAILNFLFINLAARQNAALALATQIEESSENQDTRLLRSFILNPAEVMDEENESPIEKLQDTINSYIGKEASPVVNQQNIINSDEEKEDNKTENEISSDEEVENVDRSSQNDDLIIRSRKKGKEKEEEHQPENKDRKVADENFITIVPEIVPTARGSQNPNNPNNPNNVAARSPSPRANQENKSFLRKHWGKILLGGLIGATIVGGLIVAGVFTFGAVPAVAAIVTVTATVVGVTVAPTAAAIIGVVILSVLGIGTGVAVGAAAGGLVGIAADELTARKTTSTNTPEQQPEQKRSGSSNDGDDTDTSDHDLTDTDENRAEVDDEVNSLTDSEEIGSSSNRRRRSERVEADMKAEERGSTSNPRRRSESNVSGARFSKAWCVKFADVRSGDHQPQASLSQNDGVDSEVRATQEVTTLKLG